MDLRLATYADVPVIKDLVLAFYQESPYRDVPFDHTKVDKVIDALLSNDDAVTVLLVDEANSAVGIIAGYISELIFSHDKVASEAIWYVAPLHRGKRVSLRMVDAFEFWANKRGCKYVHMSLLANNDRVGKIYNRKGFTSAETSYLKRI